MRNRKKGGKQGAGGGDGGKAANPAQPQHPNAVTHGLAKLPRKKMYRARAHSNPLSDQIFEVPENPDRVDW